jgi:ribonucleoside-triphosphate reductase
LKIKSKEELFLPYANWNYDGWSNLAKVVYKRTYARTQSDGSLENWFDTSFRTIDGNLKLVDEKYLEENEQQKCLDFFMSRKMTTAGRGLWMSGTKASEEMGGAALNNCWFLTADDWNNYVIAQDLLMLGGGVGMSVEHRFVSKLPKVKKGVEIYHKATKDADFIVPDSREGWCELTRKTLEAFFVTGKGFSFSTVCVRGAGEPISGFGGKASGPLPMINFISNVSNILNARQNKHIRPTDASDILCAIAHMVVAGNVRRSALMVLGDPWDKEFLTIKRWDLHEVPNYRYKANFSVVADDYQDLHPLFWDSYNEGEPIGIFNRKNAQKFGRMGEKKKDNCIGVNPCAEATLEDGEPCNLLETYLPNLTSLEEWIEAARMATRMAIRTTCAHYHHPKSAKVIAKNRRIGIGITGVLGSPLFTDENMDIVYKAVDKEAESYCAQLGIPKCIKVTVIKPSGTVSKVGDCLDGCHPAYSRYLLQRVRFASNDALVPLLKAAGHNTEMETFQDGSKNPDTVVVDFYLDHGPDVPCADDGFDTWKQLDVLLRLQKHWADQAVSITVYYKKEEVSLIKDWVAKNLKSIKTISFLLHKGHGFVQAPKEPITKEQFEELSVKVRPINIGTVGVGKDLGVSDCEGGACPVK